MGAAQVQDMQSLGQNAISPTSLRFLLLGDVGLGKTAFIHTFISTLANIQSTEVLDQRFPDPVTSSNGSSPSSYHLPTVHVRTAPILQSQSQSPKDPLGLLPPKIQVPPRELSFVTLPGYSSTTNPSSVLDLTDAYLNHHLHTTTSIFSPSIPSSQLAWFLIAGSGAHSLPTCAFYFVLYELKPIDILYMKLIHERVNVVPIITKADTVSEKELWVLKKRMIRQLKLNGIKFHTFGVDLAEVEHMTEQRQWGAAPFAVSTRRDQSGTLFNSDLQSLVRMCLYDGFRLSQQDAAHKVIAWRKAFGPSDVPATTAAEKIWGERSSGQHPEPALPGQPLLEAQVTGQYIEQVDTGFTPAALPLPPPPQSFVVDPTSFTPVPSSPAGGSGSGNVAVPSSHPGSALPKPLSTWKGAVGLASPTLSTAVPSPVTSYVPSPATSYVPAPATTYVPATAYSPRMRSEAARLALIQQSTGMTVDSSDRPNVIMDEMNVNTVHTQQEDASYMGSYFTPPPGSTESGSMPSGANYQIEGSEFKVEVPCSTTTYQPAAYEVGMEVGMQLPHHDSFILPNGYQAPGTFLVPATGADLYQATLMSSTVPGSSENLSGIWEAVELNDLAKVQQYLNNGVSPDQRNNSRSTLLHRAAWHGGRPYAIMHLLIAYGANVNLANENGNTVLQNVLMKHDDPALIKLLLDSGAESTVLNNGQMNTLEVAALFNQLESVRYLLENDFASSEPESIENAMQRAKGPDKKLMKALLKSWQGKEGERKRAELMERVRGEGLRGQRERPSQSQSQSQSQLHLQAHDRSLSQMHNPSLIHIADGNNSVHSFDTNKGGDGNAGSSKASSLHHEGPELGSSTTSSTNSTTPGSSSQSKHMSRFNLKTMRAAAPSMGTIFGRK